VLEVWVELPPNETRIRFLATHLDYRPDNTERLASVEVLNKLAWEDAEIPAILAGDLNDMPGSEPLARLRTHWSVAGENALVPTFPADKPERVLDYILYFPPDRWRVVSYTVIDEPMASDHRPVLVEFVWSP
jgi:endonuclease/exonuclease/phosphatase family metal-dependent hydrolase